MMKDKRLKRPIALRFRPLLLQRIDDILPYTRFKTRTELIETACALFVTHLAEELAKGEGDSR